jgi:hypothetical protein
MEALAARWVTKPLLDTECVIVRVKAIYIFPNTCIV